MDNRKNTILLTVIAVATLLVAVVGATFAYFSAQGGSEVVKEVRVETNTTNSSSFSVTNAITVTANQDNFGLNAGDRSGSTTATATFTANNAADATFCYNVSLVPTTNDFQKAEGSSTAELTFKAEKGAGTSTLTTVIEAQDITVGTAEVKVPTALNGSSYEHKISATKGSTVVDNWQFTVTFVNLGTDQNYNTAKTFTGNIKFTAVTCAS